MLLHCLVFVKRKLLCPLVLCIKKTQDITKIVHIDVDVDVIFITGYLTGQSLQVSRGYKDITVSEVELKETFTYFIILKVHGQRASCVCNHKRLCS
jgi:hypothetical protein